MILPIERLKMVMTRGKDDEKALYDLLGNKDERKKFDTQFKKAESNFKIAIVVDMWLTTRPNTSTGASAPTSRRSSKTNGSFYLHPPDDRDEVYKEIFEQAENFKKYQTAS